MSTRPLVRNLVARVGEVALLRALSHGPFALLWAGQAVSRLGDSLYRIALAWWVLEKTGSATAMGTVLICSFTPMVIFLLLGGVAVDRFPRLLLMFGSDVLSGSVVATVAALAWMQQLELWHVYLASVLFGLVESFFQPAYQAAIPDLTPAELLPSANGLTSLSAQMIGIVGPGFGATLVALGGTPSAFAIDAASFFASAICIAPLLRVMSQLNAKPHKSSVLKDVRAGLAIVASTPWLLVTIAIFSLVNVTKGGPFSVALPFLVKQSLGGDVKVLGTISSCIAAGAVVAAIWLGRRQRLRHRGVLAYGAALVSGLTMCTFGLPVGLIGLCVAGFVSGACIAVFSLVWTNTLQELVPRDLLGRVVSIDMLGSLVLLPVGFGLAGWVTDLIGPTLVFLIGGVLTTGLIALGLAHPAVRRLD